MKSTGSLYIVATPIGNLKDITLRAVKILKSVDLVLSENTSETQKLLNEFKINTPQAAYREDNRAQKIDEIITWLKEGQNLALVSDSGTPLISDPGFKLVEEIRENNIKVIPVPGPSALLAGLSASGLPTDKFTFVGFLPRSKNKRMEILKKFGDLDATLIIYESPYRVLALLEQIKKSLGNRYVCVAKELTKIHEEFIYGYVDDLLKEKIKTKGEFVVMVAKEGYGPAV